MRKKHSKEMMKGCECRCSKGTNCGGAVYGLGFVGATVYYISTASGFWVGVLGILKAAIWPAVLVFKLLSL